MGDQGQWNNQSAFLFAAIGSAVGLGNIWRFPYMCANNGGGAFLVAVIVALLTAGIPIMISEYALGHKYKRSCAGIFSAIKPQLEIFAWVMLGILFMITAYYAVVISWSFKYLWDSFTLAWGNNPADFFNITTLGKTAGPLDFAGIKLPLLIALVLTWTTIVACVWKGAETISKIIAATVIIPWLILLVLIIRGVTLDGAIAGLVFYIKPTFSKLLEPKVWLAAYSQVFFSLGLAHGIMITYASYLPKKAPITTSAYIVCISDTLTAVLGGLAVFGGIGYLSNQTGTPISELSTSGPGLAFIVYPSIISNLPFLPTLFAILFFVMLMTIGINSAFSMVESIAAAIREKFEMSYTKSNSIVAAVGFIFGLFYITGSGIYWLQIVDYFIGVIGICTACLIQCIIVGWIFDINSLRNHINSMPGRHVSLTWKWMIKIVAPSIMTVLFFSEIAQRIAEPYGGFPRSVEITAFIISYGFVGLFAYICYNHKNEKFDALSKAKIT